MPALAADWLVVLAKEPVAGQSKTRLARDIGSTNAQVLAEAFALDTLDLAASYPNAECLVAYAPSEGRSWFESHAPASALRPQPEGTLGPRIHAAVCEALLLGATRCVVLGTDTPHLEHETISAAFDALDDHDVCIGPAADGGYYLIGVRADHPKLFEDIPWSTAQVRAITLERSRQAGLSVALLPTELDVDEGSNLEDFAEVLHKRPRSARRSRAALASMEWNKS